MCLYLLFIIDLIKYDVPFYSLFDMSIFSCSDIVLVCVLAKCTLSGGLLICNKDVNAY